MNPRLLRLIRAAKPLTPEMERRLEPWSRKPETFASCPDCGQKILGNDFEGHHVVLVGAEAVSGPCPERD